jgi:NAD(P)-dependent dehydrogenase (short-subunit alcohol dehydrogenase family)
MDLKFKNKVALVTGSSFGIGRATAIAFGNEGASVICIDWMDDEDTVSQIEKSGSKAIFIKCDVSDESSVKNAIEKGVGHFGRLDFAFNNAGIEGEQGATAECSTENWQRTLGINLNGVYYCMKYQIPQMLKDGSGSIVNCASVAGLAGFEGLPAYVASKHAVVGLTKTAALEYGKKGVRVNAVCPGVIKTPMIDRFTGKDKAAEKQFVDMEPIGRLGEPEEVASAVLWLCSETASFVTGAALPVDGGWMAK